MKNLLALGVIGFIMLTSLISVLAIPVAIVIAAYLLA